MAEQESELVVTSFDENMNPTTVRAGEFDAPTPAAAPSPLSSAIHTVADALRRLGPCNDVSLSASLQREADRLDQFAKGL